MDKREIEIVFAEVARKYPIENQLKLFMEKVVYKTDSGPEFFHKLRIAKYLIDKTKQILVTEMSARGTTSIMTGFKEVDDIEKIVDDLLKTENEIGTS
jgi:hypothetical protein